MSRSSSAQVNASGHEGTDIDEETDEMVRRPSSDRQRKNLQIPPVKFNAFVKMDFDEGSSNFDGKTSKSSGIWIF